MKASIQDKKQIFSQWVKTAQEFSAGEKTFLEYAEATLQASSVLTPDPAGEKHHVWIPLADIMETAKITHPENVELGLLSQNSITQGYQRFTAVANSILNYGCIKGIMTVNAAEKILHSVGVRGKKIAALTP